MALYLVHRRPIVIGYHESLFDTALALEPSPNTRYVVMSSRGRGTPRTSAADIALRQDAWVRAPVTGTVVAVRNYRLYCGSSADIQVVIRPDDARRRRVVVLHVRDVVVRPGERVVYAHSKIGKPRKFPFRSQIDSYTRGSQPHVHVEVERGRSAPVPGCRT